MVEQIIITFISLILGSILTMGVTYFSQRMSSNVEKEKVVREKIEELYTLTIQMKTWMQTQLLCACKLEEITWHSDRPDWYVTDATIGAECPINRVEMLVKLYVPSLRNPFAAYRWSVLETQTLEGILKRNESKSSLEALAANKHYHIDIKAFDADEEKRVEMVIDFLRDLSDTFCHYHQSFQEALEKLVLKC